MNQDKKVILIGPSGVGKTTIRNIFFDKKNPTQLLEFPLAPSRGINSEVYSYMNKHLGIFDLAGQENESWFSEKGSEIFAESNAIICIFDIKNSLESIIEFLIKLHRLREELNLFSCYFAAFLHKTDKVNPSYVEQKIRKLHEFFSTQKIMGKNFHIYGTSIKENYFFNTFYTISEILNRVYDEDNIVVSDSNKFKNMKEEISLILEINTSNNYSTKLLAQEYEIKNELMIEHLKSLEKLGLVKNTDNYTSFQLTERATYIKVGWEREKLNNIKSDLNRNLEIFHVLLILNYDN